MTKKILVVDDAKSIRVMSERLLNEYGDVMTAYNGYEALNIIRENTPDVALVDVMMPELDGLALTRIIDSNPEYTFPIVMLTSNTSTFDEEQGLLCGAKYYLKKPFNPQSVKDVLEEIFNNGS